MGYPLPRATRIASPSFDRSVGVDVLALGAAGLAAPLVAPAPGAYLLFGLFAAALYVASRRRTVGAYDVEDGLVVRGFFGTHLVPWDHAVSVEEARDPWLPWLKVAGLRRDDGAPVAITGLRHRSAPTQQVLHLTRVVRDRREAGMREPWSD